MQKKITATGKQHKEKKIHTTSNYKQQQKQKQNNQSQCTDAMTTVAKLPISPLMPAYPK